MHVTVPRSHSARTPGLIVHRRALDPRELTQRHRIPITTPLVTLVDLAATFTPHHLEAAVNQADKLDLVHAGDLPSLLASFPSRPGLAALRRATTTFHRTDSELERRFLRLVRAHGLPAPLTQQSVAGFRVDFHWPQFGLVVETDGLRYHRTAASQARDLRRDQAHEAAGLTALRFSHAQIRDEPQRVAEVLARVITAAGRAETA